MANEDSEQLPLPTEEKALVKAMLKLFWDGLEREGRTDAMLDGVVAGLEQVIASTKTSVTVAKLAPRPMKRFCQDLLIGIGQRLERRNQHPIPHEN
jgi:hypothetical protein